MAVLDPVKVVLDNYPEKGELVAIENNPEDPGCRSQNGALFQRAVHRTG